MDSLDHYVKLGKILYLGASNLPAWIVAGCNSYAKWVWLVVLFTSSVWLEEESKKRKMLIATTHRATGRTPFSTYQGKWSVLE